MKRIAFVFLSAPHTTSAGREGLDALLATSAFSENITVFFIGDGVLQLLPDQQPDKVLARDYISTFKALELYDIEQCYLCAASLRDRGLLIEMQRIIKAEPLEPEALREMLNSFDTVITF